jgi:hypothetical protein
MEQVEIVTTSNPYALRNTTQGFPILKSDWSVFCLLALESPDS